MDLLSSQTPLHGAGNAPTFDRHWRNGLVEMQRMNFEIVRTSLFNDDLSVLSEFSDYQP
jgi:hypothetical protein